MSTRERFKALTAFQPFDRLPIVEWAGWWDQTIDRWHSEQLPAELEDRYDICRHFGLDIYRQDWPKTCRPECPKVPSHGAGIMADEADYEKLLPLLYPEDAIDLDKWKLWAEEQSAGESVIWSSIDGFFWFPRRLRTHVQPRT